jgi:hypothetical protein
MQRGCLAAFVAHPSNYTVILFRQPDCEVEENSACRTICCSVAPVERLLYSDSRNNATGREV